MRIKDLYVQTETPQTKGILWVKPVNNHFDLFLNWNGSWTNVNADNEVTDITAISSDVLNALKVGDQVIKVTGKQKHLYTVSYKGDGVGEGICLTYVDASTAETVSYDYTADGWVYNSTDVTTFS